MSVRARLAVALIVVVVASAAIVCTLADSPGSRRPAGQSPSSASSTPSPNVTSFRRAVGRPTRVLFTGDSLTAGFFASSDSAAFPALVQGWVGTVTTTVAQRANQTLTTVSGITEVPADLDIAVIELGTNDVGRTAPQDFDSQYGDLVRRIRAGSPAAAIACLGVWSATPGIYDAAIQQRCAADGGVFIPLSALFSMSSLRGPAGITTPLGRSDDFHPNDSGHRAIAEAIIGALAAA